MSKSVPKAMNDFYGRNELAREDTDTFNDEPSMTRQEFADECDINTIMARYETTGVINHFSNREPRYFDFTAVPDNLMDAMHQMHDAETAFMTLPAKVRREFDNDPVKFVEFAAKPENLDQMRQWELAPPAEQEQPQAAPAPVVPAAPAAEGGTQ